MSTSHENGDRYSPWRGAPEKDTPIRERSKTPQKPPPDPPLCQPRAPPRLRSARGGFFFRFQTSPSFYFLSLSLKKVLSVWRAKNSRRKNLRRSVARCCRLFSIGKNVVIIIFFNLNMLF